MFPECVARVPVSLWGSGGWECVRSTLRNRPQPFATVRNRSREQQGSRLEVSASRSFVSRGRHGTSWHSDVFVTRRKSFCVAGAKLLRRSRCSFRGRRSTLDFRRVALRVFCESHCQGCVKWRQGANSVAGIAFEMGCKLTEASQLANLEVTGKLVGKCGFWSYKVRNFEEASHKMLLLIAPTCLVSSLWFSCGLAVSMHRGSCKTFPFQRCHSKL